MPSGKEYSFYDKRQMLRQSFPFSTMHVIISIVMWGFIFLCAYLAVSLTWLYFAVLDDTDLQGPCQQFISSVESENLHKLNSYPRGLTGPYIARFTSARTIHMEKPTVRAPVVVTAVSSAQFFQFQGLIQHLMEDIKTTYPDLRIVVYDVGLYAREIGLIKKYCDCDLRTFSSSPYPDHVADFSNLAWRPIMLQLALDEFGAIIYLEPTARLKGPESIRTIQGYRTRDFLVWDLPIPVDVLAYTSPGMFEFFGEPRCAFKDIGMIDMEILVLTRTNRTWNMLMKPWLKCALSATCIEPTGARPSVCFHVRKPKTTGCHWYDQSALSIVIHRALQVTLHRDQHIPPRLTLKSMEEVQLFPEQPWTNFQLCLLILVPLLFYIAIFKRRMRSMFWSP